MVGMTRFERATPSSQARCATKLRYIPMMKWMALPTSHKTILNCFVRQSATSRYYGWRSQPLTKQYSIVLFGRVLHPDILLSRTLPLYDKQKFKSIITSYSLVNLILYLFQTQFPKSDTSSTQMHSSVSGVLN